MTPLDLERPRDVGDLLTLTISLFLRHSGLFLAVTLLVVAPLVIGVEGVWGQALADGPEALEGNDGLTATLVVLLTFVIPPLVTAMHAVIVRELGRGQVPTVGGALLGAAPRFLAAIGAVVVYSLLVGLGTVLLVVPGIWLLVLLYFAAQAAVLDGVGPIDALRRSRDLVRGRWWQTFGALIASWIVFGLVTSIVQAAVSFVDSGLLYVTVTVVVQAVGLSLTALFGTLLFFSHRAGGREPQLATA